MYIYYIDNPYGLFWVGRVGKIIVSCFIFPSYLTNHNPARKCDDTFRPRYWVVAMVCPAYHRDAAIAKRWIVYPLIENESWV